MKKIEKVHINRITSYECFLHNRGRVKSLIMNMLNEDMEKCYLLIVKFELTFINTIF